MKRPRSGGGWKAIGYSIRLARRVGWTKMWTAMRSRNSCKTCAVGMGGQLGGMVNEAGYFPEVCKKSFQAMASDLQPAIPADFFESMSRDKLRAMTSRQLEYAGRLTQPMLLTESADNYQPIEWDQAFDLICDRLRAAGPSKSFFYASGRSSNEAGFLLQLWARLFGTNYVNNCSYYCHQASGVGLGSSIGTGAGTIRLEDLDHTDLYILIGANPSSNHPRLMKSLMQIRRRGGKVIVINPARELGLEKFRVPSDVRSLLFGTEIATHYIQPHIGGDLALLTGVAKHVLDSNAEDSEFIAERTVGFAEFRAQVAQTSWDEIVSGSGVSRDEIALIGDLYAKAKNVVIGWCMGITHHLHGTQNVQMIANVALLRGMVGRRQAGVMPIRGHSNVQGLGSVGVTPALKQFMIEKLEARFGFEVPKSSGLDTMACMDAAERGEIGCAICLGGNLYGSNPALQRATDALSRIQTVVYLSTTLNTGHIRGLGRETLILPVVPRDEESQPTTQESMFSFVRMSDGGPARFQGPRSEVSILSSLGQMMFGADDRIDWKQLESHESIRELIGEMIPGYEAISEIDQTKREFHVTGRAVDEYRFPTKTGLAQFHAIDLPADTNGDDSLRLMTVRSEGQFNSVVYDEEDLYRGQERRDIVLMHPDDIDAWNLVVDQPVRVFNDAGELRYIRVRAYDVRPGNVVMYYPEANVLVPATVDPLSRTPGFKSSRVRIEPERSA